MSYNRMIRKISKYIYKSVFNMTELFLFIGARKRLMISGGSAEGTLI